jgi:hypothetical protein
MQTNHEIVSNYNEEQLHSFDNRSIKNEKTQRNWQKKEHISNHKHVLIEKISIDKDLI